MGSLSLPLLLALVAAPMAPAPFTEWLQQSDRQQLEQGCVNPAIGTAHARRQQIRDRLLELHPAPQPFEVVMADAMALLRCGSPDSAAVMLNRTSPGSPEQRRRWLLLRWRAASAGLDHRQASLALRRLVEGDLQKLAGLTLEPGRNGLDQLAEHEAALGHSVLAAELLLLAPSPAPQRLGRAAEWLASEDSGRADALLEAALDQAAADQAWGLAVELLQQQLRLQRSVGLSGDRPRQRLERLSAQLGDRYGLWQLQGGVGEEPLPRSPRQPGGHAAVGDSSDASLP